MDEEEIELLKEETLKTEKKGITYNLIIATSIIVIYIGLQMLSGKIALDDLFGDKYLPADYKPKTFIENLYEKIINLKEYLIFFSALSVLFIIIHRSNLDYEKDYMKINNVIKKKVSNLETIIEENENEEKEKND
jgi:hypothetical protein